MHKNDSSSWSEIKSLDERLAREPDSFCFARLSEIYLKVGLIADALHTARQGVARHPGYLAGQRALAMACHASGLDQECRTILEHVAAATPEDVPAQKLLASLYVAAGDAVSARGVYTTLLDFNPDDAQSKALQEELQLSHETVPAYDGIPSPAIVAGKLDVVVEEDIYELSEDDVVYGDEEAEESFDAELEAVAPPAIDAPLTIQHDPLSTQTLAELYVQQGFIVKALDIYRTILADDPANVQLQTKIAALESQVPVLQNIAQQPVALELEDLPPAPVSATLLDVSAPVDSTRFSPLAHQTADNVVETLEGWLENIRRIKACR